MILFKNAYILKGKNLNLIKTDLLVRGNKIEKIDDIDSKEFEGKQFKVYDMQDKLLLPGFINAHAHTPMTLFRNISDDSNLQEWLFKNILPKEKNLDANKVYLGALLGMFEYIKNGITTFVDMYYFPESIIKAAKKMRQRAVVLIGYHPNDQRTAEDIEKQYLEVDNSSMINKIFFNHSIYANTNEQIFDIMRLSKKHKTPRYIHLSETFQEMSDSMVRNQLTPVEFLNSFGYFDEKSIIAHGTYLEDQDIQILKEKKVSVISNPSSNLKLGSGIAPLNALLKRGVNIALGTDGAASNNSLDMFREMYLASVLQKAQMKDASVMPAEEVVKMATVNAAKALCIDDIGVIEEGYKADIVAIDLSDVNLQPLNNIINSVVYSAGPQNVHLTMIDGKIIYIDGNFNVDVDYENIIKQLNKTI